MDIKRAIVCRIGATFIGWYDYLFLFMWRTKNYYVYLNRGFIDDD